MKNLFLMMLMLGLMVACGSSKTEAEDAAANAQTEVETTVEEVSTNVEEEANGVAEEVTTASEGASYTCSRDGDERTIRIDRESDMVCDVYYSKFGSESKIGSAQYGAEYCVKLAEKVKGNLEGAGFSCSM